jgi:hypothetical protein
MKRICLPHGFVYLACNLLLADLKTQIKELSQFEDGQVPRFAFKAIFNSLFAINVVYYIAHFFFFFAINTQFVVVFADCFAITPFVVVFADCFAINTMLFSLIFLLSTWCFLCRSFFVAFCCLLPIASTPFSLCIVCFYYFHFVCCLLYVRFYYFHFGLGVPMLRPHWRRHHEYPPRHH